MSDTLRERLQSTLDLVVTPSSDTIVAAGDGDLPYTTIAQLFLTGGMQPLRDNARFLAVLKRYRLDPWRFYKRSTR